MSKIFISHSSLDNSQAAAVGKWLVREGWNDLFLDFDPVRGIAAGERWQQALKDAADRCETILFLVSPAWIKSRWCEAELNLAKLLGKRTFGVIVERTAFETIPIALTGESQLVDLAALGPDVVVTVTPPRSMVPVNVRFNADELAKLRKGLRLAGLAPDHFEWPPPGDPDRSPYRGLAPLDIDDAGIFFGRESRILQALDRLRAMRETRRSRLFVVLGASGAGKSSLLRAGLLPRLMRDSLEYRCLPVVRPERAVLSGRWGLAQCLTDALRRSARPMSLADVRAALTDAKLVSALLDRIQATAGGGGSAGPARAPTLVLPLDQAEELLAPEGRAEAARFLPLLVDVMDARRDMLVIVTARSDTYDQLQRTDLWVRHCDEPFGLGPVPQGAFKEIVEQPTKRLPSGRRLEINPDLTEALLHDLAQEPAVDALPLLAFAMEQLYFEHGGDGVLEFEEYVAFGRLGGAVSGAVDRALQNAGPRDEVMPALCRAFVPWMVRVDRQRKAMRRVARWSELPEASRPYVRLLVDHHLLVSSKPDSTTTDGQAVVQIAHESLLRQWADLTEWIDDEYESLRDLDSVEMSAAEWAEKQTDDRLAHRGERLAGALRLLDRPNLGEALGDRSREYLQRCQALEYEEKQQRDEAEASKLRAIELEEQGRRDREEALMNEGKQILRNTRLVRRAAVLLSILALGLFALAAAVVREARRTGLNESRLFVQLAAEAERTGHLDRAQRLSLAAIAIGWRRFGVVAPEAEPLLARTTFASRSIARLVGHSSKVETARFSPDGERVLTASEDGTTRLWDATSGDSLFVLRGHTASVLSATFSPDGRRVVTASTDSTARLWDGVLGASLAVLGGHNGSVLSAAFSPDGRRVVTASADGSARVWDAGSGDPLAVLRGHNGWIWSAVFSPDGRRVVTASADGSARVWDAASGDPVTVLQGHNDWVRTVVFSPDGGQLLTASDDKTARVWDAASGDLEVVLRGHTSVVTSAVFSPDGRRVLTSGDNTVRLWDAKSGELLTILRGHGDWVGDAVFSPDGRRVAAASADVARWDIAAVVWDLTSRDSIAVLRGHDNTVTDITFSPDGRWVVTASADGTGRVWQAKSAQAPTVVTGYEAGVTSAAFSTDNQRLVVAHANGDARIFDVPSGRSTTLLSGHTASIHSAVFSPGRADLILTGSEDSTARVWHAESGKSVAVLRGHNGAVQSAAFSPDGRWVVTASRDGTARVWNALSWRSTAVLRGHAGPVSAAFISAHSDYVVTTSLDNTARLWEATSGKLVAILREEWDGVKSAVFSADGRSVVTAGRDAGSVHLWSVSGEWLGQLPPFELTPLSNALLSPDGRRLIVLRVDGVAKVWDVASWDSLAVLDGAGPMRGSALSPDGHWFLAAGSADTLRVWDVSVLVQAQPERAVCTRLIGSLRSFDQHEWSALRWLNPDPALRSPCSAAITGR